MTTVITVPASAGKTRSVWSRLRLSNDAVRPLLGIAGFLLIWELGARSEQLFGVRAPWLGALPPPEEVLETWSALLFQASYWSDLHHSFLRVLSGFAAALLLGVPFGLLLALNRYMHDLLFPVFEVVRPIPPIAWVPASILFWPTKDLSIGFVIFLGAFFTIVLNVIGGARTIDRRYIQAARSMGASKFTIFRTITLPSVLPSMLVGAVVGMGISWEVVIAGELISGGGSAQGGGGGIGFFIWNAYMAAGDGAEAKIIVGMVSIGMMGYLSSEIIRLLGRKLTPGLNSR